MIQARIINGCSNQWVKETGYLHSVRVSPYKLLINYTQTNCNLTVEKSDKHPLNQRSSPVTITKLT